DVARGPRLREPAGRPLSRGDRKAGAGGRPPRPGSRRPGGADRQPRQPRRPHGLGPVRRTTTMERLARLSLLAPAVLLACATSSTPAPATAPPPPAAAPLSDTATPDAPFRKTLPEPGPPVTFKAPVPTVRTLKNGLPVWIVQEHDAPP